MPKKEWKPEITIQEFEKGYISRSGITQEYYDRWFITLPCDCGEGGCEGWAAIRKGPDIIHSHCQFSFPPIVEYLKYANANKK